MQDIKSLKANNTYRHKERYSMVSRVYLLKTKNSLRLILRGI